jgi:hypothetical protein
MIDPAVLAGITVKLRDGAANTWALLHQNKFDPARA